MTHGTIYAKQNEDEECRHSRPATVLSQTRKPSVVVHSSTSPERERPHTESSFAPPQSCRAALGPYAGALAGYRTAPVAQAYLVLAWHAARAFAPWALE
jgi:hypothetical protein